MANGRMANKPIRPFAHSPFLHLPFSGSLDPGQICDGSRRALFLLALTAHEVKWPKRLILMSGYGLLIALLVILPLLPLWPGWDNWAVLQAGSGAGRSLLALLVLGFKDAWGVNFAFDFSRALLFGLYTLIYLYILVRGQKPVVSSQRSVISNLPTFQSSNLPILQPSNLPSHRPLGTQIGRSLRQLGQICRSAGAS